MQKIKVDLSIERKLISLLVMNDEFISKLRPILNTTDLSTSYAKEVASWCIEFYDTFEKAPGQAIQDIFIAKREYIAEEDTTKAIGEFLSRLFTEFDEKMYENIPYYITQSETHLRRNSVQRLADKLASNIAIGDVDKAEHLIASYHRIEVPSNQGISLLDDEALIRDAFLTEQEVAFRFPGALGKVIGNVYLGDLIGWTAPYKTGKTWALLYSAEQAMLAGKRVLFISLEMRRSQLIKRAWQSLTSLPMKAGTYESPKFIRDGDEGTWNIVQEEVRKEALNVDDINDIQKSFKRMSRGGDVRYITLPSKMTTVDNLEVIMDNLSYYENFNTDVLVIDYADILGVPTQFKGGEYRHKMDEIWSNLRRVAQERNITIFSASQTNRDGIDAEELSAKNLAEDIRKAGHVAKLIGLSRLKADRVHNGARINMIYERDEQETFDSAYVLQNFGFGRFYLDSRFISEVNLTQE